MPELSCLVGSASKIEKSPQCRAQGVFSCSDLCLLEVCSVFVAVGMAEPSPAALSLCSPRALGAL